MSRGGRTAKVVLTLLTSLAMIAGPAIPGAGAPPNSAVVDLPFDDWRETSDGWQVAEVTAHDIVTLGVDLGSGSSVEYRTRTAAGWGRWEPFTAPGEHAPDASSAETSGVDIDVSEPVWTGGRPVEVRVPAGDPPPTSLRGVTVAGGDGLAWTPPRGDEPGAADALSVWPPMVPRSSWDPEGECQPAEAPDYAASVERAYVHHTAIFPDYLPEEADDAVRAMCIFHVEGRGFADIGYNFLVDRYGRIYQGRAGGILRPVIGAHASGFNTGSVGIALIGNFDEHGVPPAALDALDRLTSWLFEWHGIDPYAVTPHVSTGGATTPHEAGTSVMLPAIVGHRQTATNTSCPGDLLFEHVNGADPASHRIATRLRERGIDVGEPIHPPATPRVVAAPEATAAAEPRAAVGRVLQSVVEAVRSLTARRLDERLLPIMGGGSAR